MKRKFNRKINDMNDITIRTIKEEKKLPYSDLIGAILGCCFEVIKELGPCFLEEEYSFTEEVLEDLF